MYQGNFWKIPTFTMCRNQFVHQNSTNQPKTNKMAVTGGQIKMTIDVV